MTRPAGLLVAVTTSALAASLAAAAPQITQIPASDPVKYTITDVSNQNGNGPSTYEITVEEVLQEVTPPLFPQTSFNIRRSAANSTESITIKKLTIIRPASNDAQLAVTIGGSEATGVNGLFKAVQEIYADPRDDDGQDNDDQKGYVSVIAYLNAGSGNSALGAVDGTNYLQVNVPGGNVTGPITCVMHPKADPGNFQGDDYRSSIFLEGNGSLLGHVIMQSWTGASPIEGVIEQIKFQDGDIGAANSKIDIQADGVMAMITAKNIHANIRATSADADSFVGVVDTIEAKRVSSSGGDFSGELRAENFASAFGLTRGVSETLHVEGIMSSRVWVQRMATSTFGVEISNSTPSLTGSISIAPLDPEEGADGWDSDIEVLPDGTGQIILTGSGTGNDAAGYDPARTAASLGGGAVGVVPFRLHANDCFPEHDEKIDPVAIANWIEMRHYGPVTWNSANGAPFKVQRRKAGSTNEGEWVDQDCFTCSAHATNSTIVVVSKGTPDEEATGTFQRGFEYRVVRLTKGDGSNVLRSDLPHLAIANDPEVSDYEPLKFRVCDTYFASAPGDGDDNGIVDNEDIDSVLANWGSTACMKFGDANRDNVVNSTDLDTVELYDTQEYCYASGMNVNAPSQETAPWFMDLEQESGAMSEPMSFAQALGAMGYADTDDFGEAFDAMNPAAREAARSLLMALMSGE